MVLGTCSSTFSTQSLISIFLISSVFAFFSSANPTFFLHSQYVVHARIASIGEASPEELEIIGAMRLFTMAELRQLNMDGGFDDGLTLAAMALCGLSL